MRLHTSSNRIVITRRLFQLQQRTRRHQMRGGAGLRGRQDEVAMPAVAAPLPVNGDEHQHRDVSEKLGTVIASRFLKSFYV